jgi:diadenylate cyclase
MAGLAARLLHDLRWQDVVDILLLTALFSIIYRLIRRTVAVQVALALLILMAGSWGAREMGLILTSHLLSAVGAVAAIAIVVLFQVEIRRTLTHLNPTRWWRRGPAKGNRLDESAIIAEAAFALAARKKGALIMIPRWDPLVDHVTAGTAIDARVSAPLIETIFTSTSPLHDGAVVIRDGKLQRAGAVLPLATEQADPSHGTRHRAALGLAQVTDALVVCVSEEHGTVSLAHDDQLESAPDKAQLRRDLQLLGTTGTARARPSSAGLGTRLKPLVPHLVILVGVLSAWATLTLDRSSVVTRTIPLEIRGVDDGVILDPPRQSRIAVELRSSRRELERLPPSAVEAYVELARNPIGTHTYRVRTRAPAGIEITSFTPDSVQITARPATAGTPNSSGK